MPQRSTPDNRPPTSAELDALRYVPLLASFFKRARTDMPDRMRRIFERHQLTNRHGAILTQLITPEQFGVGDLARRLGVSLSTASELVGDLDRAGLVDRAEDPGNRRRTLVTLPAKHRPMIESYVAVRAAPLLRAMEELSESERAGFTAGLRAWATHAGEHT
jgi:DNA-binding MarR family transcriptional regulator